MNKNTKSRLKQLRAKTISEGGFPQPLYKAKKKPFPKVNQDDDLSLITQMKMFHPYSK